MNLLGVVHRHSIPCPLSSCEILSTIPLRWCRHPSCSPRLRQSDISPMNGRRQRLIWPLPGSAVMWQPGCAPPYWRHLVGRDWPLSESQKDAPLRVHEPWIRVELGILLHHPSSLPLSPSAIVSTSVAHPEPCDNLQSRANLWTEDAQNQA